MANEVRSKRGKPKFVHNGFIYIFDKLSQNQLTTFYRCEQKDRCKARIHVQNGEVTKILNNHCHDATPAKVEVDISKTKMKQRAAESNEPTAQVINACIGNLSQAGQASMPNLNSLRKIIRRQRNQIDAPPPAPISLQELVIPDRYKTINSNDLEERFLLGDTGPREDRILLFGRGQNLQYLEQTEIWYVDGTFKSAPLLFSQVYIILAEVYGAVVPVIYALLPNKRKATYSSLIRMITEIKPGVNPRRIICDFEIAAFSAFKEQFPEARICGCFFHLSQNLQKQVSIMGLRQRYNNDADFALKAKMILSLAYVPPEHLDEAVDLLSDELPGELQELLNWFEDNYIGRPGRRANTRRPPLFPVPMWNLNNRVLEGLDRTNNHAEAANRRLQSELGMTNPTIWKFIDSIKTIQQGRDMFLQQIVAGHEPPKKLRKYVQADERILRLVRSFDERNILDFLKGVAYNFEIIHH